MDSFLIIFYFLKSKYLFLDTLDWIMLISYYPKNFNVKNWKTNKKITIPVLKNKIFIT